MKTLTSVFMACLISCPSAAYAEIQKFGDAEVNYNLVTTDTLSPKVAKAYEITRSKNRLLLTVVVTRLDAEGLPRSVSADVTASSVNMLQQQRPIPMRRIRRGRGHLRYR